ncbi:MAG: DUF2147 domain-containing protein [Sneathiella sp.]|nr:DUF2147 domain-containing protein [Sneathiella sp.]
MAKSRFFLILLTLLLLAPPVLAQNMSPVGVWLHENKRIKLEIKPCGENLCGKLVWFRWPNDAEGLPLVDLKNPDPALRTRPLLGLTVLSGLHRADDGTWKDGEIYNPDDGKEYRVKLSVQEDGNLRARVYVFLSFFGETQIWTRAE